jgi:sugar/nucleoside kinase (ribokinase family)
MHRFDPPPVWSNPPLYSDAQDIAVQDWGSMGKYSTGGIRLMKMITFTVADKEENVIAFYKKAFSNSNMKQSDWGREVAKPKALNYSWSNGAEPPSVYFVDLITTSESDNQVQVEIGMSMFPGY